MKKIVIGYDGTDTAARAAQEAAALGQATGAELHFVTVLDNERLRQGMITTEEHEQAKQAAEGTIQLLLSSIETRAADRRTEVVVVTEVISGSPATSLVEYAEAVNADLIVVGNRRVQGIGRALGSVAIAVLRHTPCSVYVAHTA